MLARGLFFSAFLAVGGLIGAVVAAWPGALVGVVLMALIAFYLASLPVFRFGGWLITVRWVERADDALVEVCSEPAGGAGWSGRSVGRGCTGRGGGLAAAAEDSPWSL